MLAPNDLPPEVTVPQTAFRMGEITYLPHYRRDVYVGPGYGRDNTREYTGGELIDMGAKSVEIQLWQRLASMKAAA